MGRDLSLILPKAVLFDMDGTLTVPVMDFVRMKAEMGLAPGEPILETMARMSPAERKTAEDVLHHHEDEAAAMATLNPGCQHLLEWIRARGIETALVTRNRRVSVDTVLKRSGLAIDVLITREDGRFKPDPQPLMLACQRLAVECAEAWMVGDGQYDVEAGAAAGIRTVWVSHGKAKAFAAEPWRVVNDLPELLGLLQACS